jgi:hypothetical protein
VLPQPSSGVDVVGIGGRTCWCVAVVVDPSLDFRGGAKLDDGCRAVSGRDRYRTHDADLDAGKVPAEVCADHAGVNGDRRQLRVPALEFVGKEEIRQFRTAVSEERVFIGLTGPDPGAPNIEMQPLGAGTFAMDSTLINPPAEWDTQSHAMTRYITVPPTDPASGASTPFVWVEAEVSNPSIGFTLQMPVLTVTVVNPTAS